MPIYEYQCRSCERRTEVMQRFNDPLLETCDTCGGELKKLISAPAFQFKGSGWYVTDYAGKGKGDDTAKDSKSESEKGSEAKSDGDSGGKSSGDGSSDSSSSSASAGSSGAKKSEASSSGD